jgi:hypothetical protein
MARKNTKNGRQERKNHVGSIDLWEFDGKDLDEVIARLQAIKNGDVEALFGCYCKDWPEENYKKMQEDLKQYHRYELKAEGYEDTCIYVYGYRWETDKEMEARKEKSRKARARAKVRREKEKAEKEESERKMLAKLMEKYGEKV